jgi:hypothetical protein
MRIPILPKWVVLLASVGACGGDGAGARDGNGSESSADTFPCGTTVRCVRGTEYCFAESRNGSPKIPHQCRPMPAGCSVCGCAKADAAPISMFCSSNPAALTCTDGGVVIQDQANSQALSVLCLVA